MRHPVNTYRYVGSLHYLEIRPFIGLRIAVSDILNQRRDYVFPFSFFANCPRNLLSLLHHHSKNTFFANSNLKLTPNSCEIFY